MRVAVLAIDGMLDTGLSTVFDILGAANVLSPQEGLPSSPFAVHAVGLDREVRTALGLRLDTAPWEGLLDDPPDVVVMPAVGLRPPQEVVDAVRSHAALPTIGSLAGSGIGLASACSGAFFLAEAGVLDGRAATTSWWLGNAFRSRYPTVDLDTAQSLVVADAVTTAGAAFAHIDLALSFVSRVSPALAELTARYLVVGDRPSQASVALPSVLAASDPVLRAFERYIRKHLADPFRIADGAAALGVSERTLQRSTTATIGMSPVRFVQEVRLDHAVHLFRTTDRSSAAIAAAVGYSSEDALRALLRRRRKLTLGGLRGH